MEDEQLKALIAEQLAIFYQRRLAKLNTLKLDDIIKRKNPYMFKTTSSSPETLINTFMSAFFSASDEGIFGDAFFEPIALSVSGGVVSPSEGVDVAIETEDKYLAISVKSGPNIFNASQTKRQNDEFMKLRSRLTKLNKQFDALLGHCYGRRVSNPTQTKIFRESSGQVFWSELTGDDDFYKKLILFIDDIQVRHHLIDFERQWELIRNRYLKEFFEQYCKPTGEIDWEKIVEINSGRKHKSRKEKR